MAGILSSVYHIQHDPMEVAWFAPNKLFVIQGKSNSLQLFKIRSQRTAMNYCQPYLERGLRMLLRRYVVNRDLFGCLWFSTSESQSWIKRPDTASGTGDLAGWTKWIIVHAGRFSSSVADVILMRYSILHSCFRIFYNQQQPPNKMTTLLGWCHLPVIRKSSPQMSVVSSSAPPDGLGYIAVGVHHAPCSTTPLLGSSLRPGLQKLSQLTDSLYKPPLGVFTQAHENAFLIPPDSALEEAAAVGGYRFSPMQRQFSVSNFGRISFLTAKHCEGHQILLY